MDYERRRRDKHRERECDKYGREIRRRSRSRSASRHVDKDARKSRYSRSRSSSVDKHRSRDHHRSHKRDDNAKMQVQSPMATGEVFHLVKKPHSTANKNQKTSNKKGKKINKDKLDYNKQARLNRLRREGMDNGAFEEKENQ